RDAADRAAIAAPELEEDTVHDVEEYFIAVDDHRAARSQRHERGCMRRPITRVSRIPRQLRGEWVYGGRDFSRPPLRRCVRASRNERTFDLLKVNQSAEEKNRPSASRCATLPHRHNAITQRFG